MANINTPDRETALMLADAIMQEHGVWLWELLGDYMVQPNQEARDAFHKEKLEKPLTSNEILITWYGRILHYYGGKYLDSPYWHVSMHIKNWYLWISRAAIYYEDKTKVGDEFREFMDNKRTGWFTDGYLEYPALKVLAKRDFGVM